MRNSTSTIKIYRIDKRSDPTRGPFVFASEALDDVANRLDCQDPNDMANMERACLQDHCAGHHFAFTSLKDVTRWFDLPMRRWLDKDGFVLSVYDVPVKDITFYTTQVTVPLGDVSFPRRIFKLI